MEKPIKEDPMMHLVRDIQKGVREHVLAELMSLYLTGKGLSERIKTPEEIIKDRLRYAWVQRLGRRVMVFMDNETMEPYMMDAYNGSCRVDLIKPITKDLQKVKFIRWCTLMDMG